MAAPDAGSKKLEAMIAPVAERAPVRTEESTLLNEELLQVPDCHELPLEVAVLKR